MAASAPEQGNETEDDFMTVSPGKKQAAKRRRKESREVETLKMHDSSNSDKENQTFATPKPSDLKCFLVPIDKTKNLNNLNLLVIAKAIHAVVGNNPVEFVKHVRNGIMVKCKNSKQMRSVKEIENIGNIPVKAEEMRNWVKGVIYGIPIEMTEREIQNELTKQKVVGVKRMMSRRNDKKENGSQGREDKIKEPIPTRNIILSFDRTNLPSEITFCYQLFKVKQFFPPTLRCFKCQRFGHGIAQCQSKPRCVRCGETHSFDECPHKETPKCVNCGGEHSAAYLGCQEAQKAKEVQRIKIEKKVSYAQAAKVWKNDQDQAMDTNQIQHAPLSQERQEVDFPVQINKQTPQIKESEKEIKTYPKQLKQSEGRQQNRNTKENTAHQDYSGTTQYVHEGGEVCKNEKNFVVNASNEEIISFIVYILANFNQKKDNPISLIVGAALKFFNLTKEMLNEQNVIDLVF